VKLKLKLIATSLSLLGFISHPTLAATESTYHSMKHHKVETQDDKNENPGYKGEEVAVACPVTDIYTLLMDAMSQNVGRAKPITSCLKPIQFAGGINFDTLWGNRTQGYQGEVHDRFALNDAYINATGHVNEWINAFIELSYNNIDEDPLKNASLTPNPLSVVPEPKPGIYSAGYTLDLLNLQQGVIIIGNPARFPIFLRVGKQFLDFGRYTIHPITRSMTQVMTETLQTAAEVSFISGWDAMALHGSLFAFQNPMTSENNQIGNTNYGGQLGLGVINEKFGWDVGAGYLYNFTGVNDIAYAVTLFNSGSDDGNGSYQNRVGAGTLYGMINSGPFSFSAHYVSALQHFNAADLSGSDDSDDDDHGDSAKPWAADILAGYGFNAWHYNQNIYLGYQESGDAVNLYLPKTRWLAGYGVDVLSNTNLGFEFSHDQDYREKDGGTGEGSYRGVLRVAVKFG